MWQPDWVVRFAQLRERFSLFARYGAGAHSMSRPRPSNGSSAIASARLIDQICDDFEAAWLSGCEPSIARFLSLVPRQARAGLFRELLFLEVAYRDRRGDQFSTADY